MSERTAAVHGQRSFTSMASPVGHDSREAKAKARAVRESVAGETERSVQAWQRRFVLTTSGVQ